MKLIARFLSYLFHPVLFFLIMPFLVVYRQTESGFYAVKWMVFSSVFVLFGVMIILFETLKGDFSDFDISRREERLKFYIIALVLGIAYLMASIFFRGVFFPLSFISLGIALGIIIFALISQFLKASIHTAVSCSFVVSMGILYGKEAFWATLWIVPLIAWARVILKKHTVVEVITGGFMGFIITIATFLVWEGLFSHRL